jgi:arylsulfatase A-like enzyme
VVLIVVDTLRKDELHVYGNPQPVSPAIDALAARGALFENHLTHASQTVPATLSLLLSRLPADHGFSPPDPMIFATERPLYPSDFLFLQEVFHDAGYATAGFTANPYLTRTDGFDQGFETFMSVRGSGEDLNRAALAWLGAQTRDHPFYLYLHYMDVHQPYRAPRAYIEQFVGPGRHKLLEGNVAIPVADAEDIRYTRSVYTACVAHQDDLVGEVLRKLDEIGMQEKTLVVFTSDHGEEFGEHGGLGHGRNLYGESVRVPLVMAMTGEIAPGRRVRHLSQHVDLAPSILELVGVAIPPAFRGKSVFERASRVFLEIGPWRGIAADGSKWLWDRASDEQQLFALADELDRTPRVEPEVAGRLRAQLDPYLAIEAGRQPGEPGKRVGAAWSPEEVERLRALGYAQ